MTAISGIKLVDLSVLLARSTLLPHLWLYYAGSVPFILYFLYFFNDMTLNPIARQRLAYSSCLVMLLFMWMKVLHSIFGLRAFETLMEQHHRRLRMKDIIRLIAWQACLSAAGLIVVPLSLIAAIPFGWCYAFFQTAAFTPLICNRGGFSESVRLSFLWPKQNHSMLWLICPLSVIIVCCGSIALPPLVRLFSQNAAAAAVIYGAAVLLCAAALALNPIGGILFVNIAAALFFLPRLLKMLLGWETLFSMSPNALIHPGFVFVVGALCFLCMDPIVKICYIVRMYDQRAIRSGHDLLKRIKHAAVIFVGMFFLMSPFEAHAASSKECAEQRHFEQQSSPFTQTAFDNSVVGVLKNPVYAWRDNVSLKVPHGAIKKTAFFSRFFTGVTDTVKKTVRWAVTMIGKIFRSRAALRAPQHPGFAALFGPRTVMALALAVIVAGIAALFWRRRKRYDAKPATTTEAVMHEEAGPIAVSPEENSHDAWERMADESMSSGNAQEAIRYLFFSSLSLLGQRRIITLRKNHSNREFAREVQRRFPDRPDLNGFFNTMIHCYEYTWFGTVEAHGTYWDAALRSHLHLKECLRTYA